MIEIESQFKDVIKIFGSLQGTEESARQGNRVVYGVQSVSIETPNNLMKIT